MMVVGNPLQLISIVLPLNSKLDQADKISSTKLRNLGVGFDENLTLMYKADTVKKEVIGGLINIEKMSNFLRESLT